MDKMLWVAMSGAQQSMLAQNVRAHNLANASTTGFKGDLAQARSMQVFGEHYPSRVYAMTESPGVDFSSGTLIETGNDLDVAVAGEGWITVLDPNGQEALTRSGELMVDPGGLLKTQQGYTVMGNGGPLSVPPHQKIEIATDGTISIRALGQGPETLQAVDRIKLANPPQENLLKGLDGLFRLQDGTIPVPDGAVRIQRGVIEGSNVNAVSEMIGFVQLARQFDMQMRLMKNAEEIDAKAARIMQLS